MIIKCPECGHQVSDKAPVCPSCGVEIAGHVIACSNCGEIYLKEDSNCPNCHHSETIIENYHKDKSMASEMRDSTESIIVEVSEDVDAQNIITSDNANSKVSVEKSEDESKGVDVKKSDDVENEPVTATVIEAESQVVSPEKIEENKSVEGEETKQRTPGNHIPLIVSLLLAIIISFVLLFFYHRGSENREGEDYEIALKSNDTGIMEQFIDKYPNAPLTHLNNIRNLLKQSKTDSKEWEKVVRQNTIDAYKTYLQVHPQTPHKAEILNRIDELAWQEAVRFNNEASYLGYREKYPSGAHAKEADEKLKVLLDNTSSPADKQTAIAVIRQFLQGINSKSSDKIQEVVAAQFTFLGASGATSADVNKYMRERLYQADVKNVMWYLSKDANATTDKAEDGHLIHTVIIPARLVIEREGGTSSKNYSVRATIENNKITTINWIQQAPKSQAVAE